MIQTPLPKAADDAARRSLSEFYGQYKGFGFVVPNLTGSQLALTLLTNINNHLDKNGYNEICLYVGQRELPIVTPNCAMYDIFDLRDYESPVVAVDPIIWSHMNYFFSGEKYLYVYDPILFKYIPPAEVNKMKSSNTKIFTRSKDHAIYLRKQFGFTLLPKFVPDCNIEIIKEILNVGTKS